MELPHLQRIYDEFRNRGLTVLAVNPGEPAKAVAEFMRGGRLTFPCVVDNPRLRNSVLRRYHISAFPMTYIIGRDRRIRKAILGFSPRMGEAELRAALAELGFESRAR